MMARLQTVEKAVTELTAAELATFRRWFAEFDADVWDRQIEADASAGKLDMLADEARADYFAGRAAKM
jgi:hypothetical protein